MTGAIVGVGNPLMGDDGLGSVVVDRLSEQSVDATLSTAGTNAFMAMEAIDGADRAVIVDALDLPEPAGSVWRLAYENGTFERGIDTTMHDFSVSSALSVGDETYDLPPDIWLVGAVPSSLEPGIGLSNPIRGAVDDVAATVCDTLGIERPDESRPVSGDST